MNTSVYMVFEFRRRRRAISTYLTHPFYGVDISILIPLKSDVMAPHSQVI